jgi:hypothetical protein
MQEIAELASKAVEKVSSGEFSGISDAVADMASSQAWPFEKVARVCQAANNALLREKKSGSQPFWSIRFETAKPGSLAETARSTVMKKVSTAAFSKVSSASEGRNMTLSLSTPPKYESEPEGHGIEFYFPQPAAEKTSSSAEEASADLRDAVADAQDLLRHAQSELPAAEFMREQSAATLQIHLQRVGEKTSSYVALSALVQAADEFSGKWPDARSYAEAAVAQYVEANDIQPDAVLLGAEKISAAGGTRSVLDMQSPMVRASLTYFKSCDRHDSLNTLCADLRAQIGSAQAESMEG